MGITALISVLTLIFRCIPAFLKMVKTGKIVAQECHDLIKWFFKHKKAGEKKLFVVPEKAVNAPVLNITPAVAIAEKVYSVPKEELHELGKDGDGFSKTPLEVEIENKWR